MKVLIVEDEVPMADLLRRGLTDEGWAVDTAHDGDVAREMVAIYDYDAIVLDVMIPGGTGFDLCHEWRRAGISTPILFLTARDEIGDRVRGLDSGGDDYLTKPFAFEELLARLRAHIRRQWRCVPAATIEIADLSIDPAAHRVFRRGQEVPLTAREFQVLLHMATHPGCVVSRTQLWEHVWESGGEPDSNVVDVYIRSLRDKIGRDPDLIETVRGAGYRMGRGVAE